jgi:hypothetical protein
MPSRRTAIIIALLLLSGVAGLLQGYLGYIGQDARISVAVTIFPFAGLLLAWCKADAAHRGISPPDGAPLLVAIFALVGIPYYFFKVLAPGRAIIHILVAYLLLIVSTVVTGAAHLLASNVLATQQSLQSPRQDTVEEKRR